ncbi:deoxyribose-phosphate aldolase [Streptomyces longispororuber]|nr:deoxyribose-phosphate aldolase [Streptomyces sp. CC224B]
MYSRYARRYAPLVTMRTTPPTETEKAAAAPPPTPAGRAVPGAFADVTASASTLRRFLHGLPGVDAVGLEARAAALGTRSVKASAKAYAIDLAISMIDLTTLEGADTAGKVRALGAKAVHPDPTDRTTPRTAAVCVYPDMVATAKEAVAGTDVKVASVATAFPAGRAPLEVKLADVREAVAAGADEIDMVIDRGAFLSGDYLKVFEEIVAVKEACRQARLKVIFETGELSTYDNIRRASWLGMMAGADFIKTSTGKVGVNATPANTLLMLQAVRDFRAQTGVQVGVKPAGGIRTSKDAVKFLVLVNETAGADWLDNHWFRFGASSLLNDLLMQRQKLATGRYSGPDYVTVD